MGPRIFISYRRDETAGHAGRLYDRLVDRFGQDSVFLDVGAIEPGEDFVGAIDRAVTDATVILVLIGRHWLNALDEQGQRRLEDEADFVRLEIQLAIEHDVPLIPILVEGAAMPEEEDLPGPIASLARRQAVPIVHAAFDATAAQVIEHIERRSTGRAQPEPAEVAPTMPSRRTVTVAVVHVELGPGATDAESAHLAFDRFLTVAGSIAERYGGTLDAGVGGSIVCIFGLPLVHEDDAVRALRAIHEALGATHELRDEFRTRWGLDLRIRAGVETGEVLVGGSARPAEMTGPPLDRAIALAGQANWDEVLVGSQARTLARLDVHLEPRAAGEGEGTPVHRLVAPTSVEEGPRPSPFVGRLDELRMLRDIYGRCVRGRTCHLVTVVGGAGAGKSRLVTEFLSSVDDDPKLLRGRCLPYGEGITYWPIAEMVRTAAGVTVADPVTQAHARLQSLVEGSPSAEFIATTVAQAMGLAEPSASSEEIFWAVRQLFQHLAASGPLVVTIDDLHWAEPTLLDLVEHLADRSREAPLLVLSLARQELLEARPTWGGGKPNAAIISVEPLPAADAKLMLERILGTSSLDLDVVARILSSAEGNPLFVEEMLTMLIEKGILVQRDGSWIPKADLDAISVPPTVWAILEARIDQLPRGDRDALRRASVIGRDFHRPALTHLTPATRRSEVAPALDSLTRRDLVRHSHGVGLRPDEAFRFRHLLIRDAAYAGLPKSLRSSLHRALAEWIEAVAGDRVPEYEEIIGYHLGEASRYLLELGADDAEGHRLAGLAGLRLTTAGRRAFRRGDMSGAAHLLSRASEMLPRDDQHRLKLLPELGEAYSEIGELQQAEVVLEEAINAARLAGDRAAEGHAAVVELALKFLTEPTGWAHEAEQQAKRWRPVFEEAGDDQAMAKLWILMHHVHVFRARFASAELASQRAAECARRAGDEREALAQLAVYAATAVFGPTPVAEGIDRCRHVLGMAEGHPSVEAQVQLGLGGLEAMNGRFDVARALIATSRKTWEEMGLRLLTASSAALFSGFVELLAGDPRAAERELRLGYERLKEMGEIAVRASVAATLARALQAQGRGEEAWEFTVSSEESAAKDDLDAQVQWRGVRAGLLAADGRHEEALGLAREALELAAPSDDLDLKAGAAADLALVLASAGRLEESNLLLEQAADLYRRKGNIVAFRRIKERPRPGFAGGRDRRRDGSTPVEFPE